MMKICYHGTNEENAQSILKEGFRPETWFAHNLQDAIGYGGNHVFEVAFDSTKFNNSEAGDWQFFLLEWIKPDKIIRHTIYDATPVFDNQELRRRIFENNT